MSYGLIASKSASVRLVAAPAGPARSGARTGTGSRAEPRSGLEQFHSTWGAAWVPGRIMLSRLRLTFLPQRVGGGSARLDLDLVTIGVVEITAGRVGRVVTLRTPAYALEIKALGAPAFAQQVAVLVEARRTDHRSQGRTPRD